MKIDAQYEGSMLVFGRGKIEKKNKALYHYFIHLPRNLNKWSIIIILVMIYFGLGIKLVKPDKKHNPSILTSMVLALIIKPNKAKLSSSKKC